MNVILESKTSGVSLSRIHSHSCSVLLVVQMLGSGDQARVAGAMRQSLASYFDADHAFWGDCSLDSAGGGCDVDPDEATGWLMGGVGSYQSLLGGDFLS